MVIPFLSLSQRGELIVEGATGASFLLACLISVAPISWKLRLGAFVGGPIAGLVGLQIFAPKSSCTYECTEGIAIFVIGGFALAAWVAGFAGVYLVHEAVRLYGPASHESALVRFESSPGPNELPWASVRRRVSRS